MPTAENRTPASSRPHKQSDFTRSFLKRFIYSAKDAVLSSIRSSMAKAPLTDMVSIIRSTRRAMTLPLNSRKVISSTIPATMKGNMISTFRFFMDIAMHKKNRTVTKIAQYLMVASLDKYHSERPFCIARETLSRVLLVVERICFM